MKNHIVNFALEIVEMHDKTIQLEKKITVLEERNRILRNELLTHYKKEVIKNEEL